MNEGGRLLRWAGSRESGVGGGPSREPTSSKGYTETLNGTVTGSKWLLNPIVAKPKSEECRLTTGGCRDQASERCERGLERRRGRSAGLPLSRWADGQGEFKMSLQKR